MEPIVQVYADELKDKDYKYALCIVELSKSQKENIELRKENDKLKKELEELKEEKSENNEDHKDEKEGD